MICLDFGVFFLLQLTGSLDDAVRLSRSSCSDDPARVNHVQWAQFGADEVFSVDLALEIAHLKELPFNGFSSHDDVAVAFIRSGHG